MASLGTIVNGTLGTVAWGNDVDANVFGVQHYGALADDSTDNKTAIDATITAARATSPKAIVYFPRGIYRTSGNHSLQGADGLTIVGEGVGQTTLKISHASNDLFTFGSGVPTRDITLAGMTIGASTTRTGGWVIKQQDTYTLNYGVRRSRFFDLTIDSQVNGIWLSGYSFVYFDRIIIHKFIGNTGIGLKLGQTTTTDVNQGSGAWLTNVIIYGHDIDLTGATTPAGLYGFMIEDTDAVYLKGCESGNFIDHSLYVLGNAGGHAPSNLFIGDSVFDGTRNNHSAYFRSLGSRIQRVNIDNSWFASAGQSTGSTSNTAAAFRADGLANYVISNNRFYNAKGNGLHIASAASGSITGCESHSNGSGDVANNRDACFIDVGTLNNVGPVITGNTFSGVTGGVNPSYSIQTSASSNRIVVSSNRILTPPGSLFNVAPAVNANNGA